MRSRESGTMTCGRRRSEIKMEGYVVSRRWRYIQFPSVWEGLRYHQRKKQLFSDSAMANAKARLPDSYYKLLVVITYGMLETDILRRKIKINDRRAESQ